MSLSSLCLVHGWVVFKGSNIIGCKQLEKEYAEAGEDEEGEGDDLTIDESGNFDDDDDDSESSDLTFAYDQS